MNIFEKYIESDADRIHRWVLLFVAITLFATLNDASLWLDEVATVSASGLVDFKSGFIEAFHDGQMPFVYFSIFVSRLLFGSNEFASRLPIVLFALGFLWVLPRLYRQAGYKPILATVAAVLLAFHGKFIFYAQDARFHMPGVCALFIWAAYRKSGSWKSFSACLIALFTHTFSVITVGATLGIDIFSEWYFEKKSFKELFLKYAPNFTALLLFSPAYLFLITLMRKSRLQGVGITDFTQQVFSSLEIIKNAWLFFFDSRSTIWIVLSLISIFAIIFRRNSLTNFLLAAVCAVLFQALIFGFTQQCFFPRYLLLLLPLVIVGSVTLLQLTALWGKLLVPVIFLSLYFLPHLSFQIRPWPGVLAQLFPMTAQELSTTHKENWRDMTKTLAWLAKPGESIGPSSDCGGDCSKYPILFYGGNEPVIQSLTWIDRIETCASWIVSTHSNLSEVRGCKEIKPVGNFSTLFLYQGKP